MRFCLKTRIFHLILKATRLGKHINELRRKASDKQLASRAKSLVKKWRELLMPASGTATPPMAVAQQAQAVQATSTNTSTKVEAKAVAQRLNGHHHHIPSQPSSRLTSPAMSSSGGSRLSPGLSTPVNNHNNHHSRHHNSSSMPSSASSSPGLSRPTTPNNHHSRPVSPTGVPKTNVANKRLRKDMDDSDTKQPPAKKAKGSPTPLNGTCDSNGFNKTSHNNKKRLSKKQMLEQEREHLLEQKLLTARRQASKVRTTQELVEELALRSSSPASFKSQSGSSSIANETKTELMNRFFESQQNGTTTTDVLSPPLSEGPSSPNSLPKTADQAAAAVAETVEDVLAQLPPIDVASILAEINSDINESDEEDIEGLIPVHQAAKKKTAAAEDLSEGIKAKLVEELHQGQHESVNGNFNHDGAFKEWHEVVAKETVNGDLLYILPYSVID